MWSSMNLGEKNDSGNNCFTPKSENFQNNVKKRGSHRLREILEKEGKGR